HNGTVPISIDGQLIDCNELYADDRDFEPGELGEVLGDGYERFDIFYMRAWIPNNGPALMPLAIEARIRERSVECTPDDCPAQYVTIRRTINDFDQSAGWVPRRETSSIDGLHNLIGNIASNFQQIITNIVQLMVNEGPPTQQRIAELIREAVEQE
ncbi:MAG: hypothetical protein R3284_07780, partial [Rubricoccaceae bacterium]|nr:hypothetical protein [Rubricoccaceae bacterium]